MEPSEGGRGNGQLCRYVDVLIANEEDSADVFGIKSEKSDINSGVLSYVGYVDVAKQLTERFGFKYVAITLRESISASINNWSGMLYDGKDAHFSTKYTIHIVDRVGGGDSFGAGLIYSLINSKTPAEAIEFAAAASCLKHTVEGDFNIAPLPRLNLSLRTAAADGYNGNKNRIREVLDALPNL
jgi:2-dehydro-3-deoxygluconokinase